MESRESIFDEVALCIEYDNNCGSGVLIPARNRKRIYVLTAHHVLGNEDEIRYENLHIKRYRNRQFEEVNFIWKDFFFDQEMDIAVIVAEYQDIYELPVATLYEDDVVYICGFPQVLQDSKYVNRFCLEGKVKISNKEELITTISDAIGTFDTSEIDTLKCYSGAGIFSSFGKGLVLAGIETEALTKDVAFHSVRNIPISYIEKLINAHIADESKQQPDVFEHRESTLQVRNTKAFSRILVPIGDTEDQRSRETELYNQLFTIFENDRKDHPSIRMMNPDPSLFPKGLPEILSDGRLAVEEKEDPRAIKDMILDSWKREDRRHILLVGEGGIGKTVAMLTLPVEDWFKELRIPVIYVPLQKLDAFSGDLNRYIREKIGYDNYDICIQQANSISEGQPRLLLLLDGFNEIPDDYKKLAAKQIQEWMKRPGIQIITTSRLGFFIEKYFLKYQLKPLPFDTVRSFLLSAGIVEEQLPRKNERIWEVINVPLMLTIYTQIEKVREAADRFSEGSIFEWKDPFNAAHIIWNYLQMDLYRCIKKDDPSYSAPQYASAILAIAPYICCQMCNRNKFYLKREDFHELIQDAMDFFSARKEFLENQIWDVRDEFAPYEIDDLFQKENVAKYARILIDNIGLFQTQKIRIEGQKKRGTTEYLCSLMHQNFRDALAAFFICSSLPKACDAKEKRALLDQADHYVKDYMAEHLSDRELVFIWDKHRKEEPEDGKITFILMDLIGRQRNYDYRELDFSELNLTRTNLHMLLSKRLDICPLPGDRNKLSNTKISTDSLSPLGHTDMVTSVSFSPDGRQVASGGFDKTVRIWDFESGDIRVLKGHTGAVSSVTFNPKGRCLASGASDKTVMIWNLKSGERRVLKDHTGMITSVTFSPDGRYLASGSCDKTVRIWDLESGEKRVLKGHTGYVRSVSFSSDGKQVASGADDNTVRIWDLESGETRVLEGHVGTVMCVSYSPDGRHLASCAEDSTVRIWDLKSNECHVFEGYVGGFRSVMFSPDGRQFASGAGDRTVRIWDLESGETRVLEGHVGQVMCVSYSPDGRQLASSAEDYTVRIWDLESDENRVLEGRVGQVMCVSYSPYGRLACSVDDRTVRIWEPKSGKSRVLERNPDVVRSISYSPDGKQLASGADNGVVRIRNLVSSEIRVLKEHIGGVNCVVFSPDGSKLASCAYDRTVWVYDSESGESSALVGHDGWVMSVAFISPDGSNLASSSDDKTVQIWDVKSRTSRVLEEQEGGRINSISVSYRPKRSQLVTGASDGSVRIWDHVSGKSRILEDHAGWVNSVAFSPDGKQVASGSDDRLVRIWNLVNGDSHVLKGHTGQVRSVAFSPDGIWVASGACDGTVRIWDLRNYREVAKYAIIPNINVSGANFELAIIDEKDKEMLRAAGAKV